MSKLGPEKITDKLIYRVSKRIRDKLHPDKIILFGSCANGQLSEDSDIDLFVVMPSDLRRDYRSMQISKLFPERRFPLDVIVYTPQEVELSLRRKNPFIKEILEKGEVLYEV